MTKSTKSQNRTREKIRISLVSSQGQFSPIKFNPSRTNILSMTNQANVARNSMATHFKNAKSVGGSVTASTNHHIRKTV